MKEHGIGYIIRTYNCNIGYWTGAYKESKWCSSIFGAKLYRDYSRAKRTLEQHKDEFTWQTAEIVMIQFEEIENERKNLYKKP